MYECFFSCIEPILVHTLLTIQTQHFLGADCVDQDICELAEAVRKHMNSSTGLNSSAGISGIIITEIPDLSRKQEHDICNGV